MKYLIYIFLFLLSLRLFSQENYRVKKVTFHGNNSIKSATLLDRMSLQPKNGLKRLSDSKGVSFSSELLRNDIQEILYYYQQNGFIHANVALQNLNVDDRKETVKISISIDEGQPVYVSHIFFKRADTLYQARVESALQQSRSKFLLTTGSRFNEADFNKDVAILKTGLLNNGFAYADVNYKLQVDDQANTVDIHYNTSTGPLCRFGDISISGNDHVKEAIIKNQLSFQQGDQFSRRDIEKTQEQVYALNVFHIVSVYTLPDKQQKASIPIGIKIREAPRFTHKYGVGWGREDQFRALVDIQWLRFLGGARRLNFYLKHSALEPYHVNLRFTQPAFLHPTASLGINPFIRRQNEPGYIVNRQGANLYVQYDINSMVNTGATYTYETVILDTASVGEIKGAADVADLYNKSSITLSVAQNNTDHIFYPSRGFNTSTAIKFSGVGPSTYTYLKWIVDLRHYMAIPGAILATRFKIGQINSMDASGFIPVEDRFFSGGSNSVRGWMRHELGPKDVNSTPIGGESLFEGSIEFRIPFPEPLNTALFWDFGNVWKEKFDFAANQLEHSVGFGIRYHTPIGPIRFDLARPIYGSNKSTLWHLSIGEAF